MYDDYYADSTLNSRSLRSKAKQEVGFVLDNLDLPIGSSILDVPCGTGRHSYLFAKQGYKVTGVDISKACIKIAKKEWGHKNLVYELADMSKLSKYKEGYNAVLNLFTSFGYFQTDKQNRKVLEGFYKTLKTGGKLGMQIINRDWLMEVFSSNDWHEHSGKYILNKRVYNPKDFYNEAWMTIIDKKSRKEKTYYHRCRLYSKQEIVGLLREIGFKKVKVFGDFEGSSFKKKESTHPFYFATK